MHGTLLERSRAVLSETDLIFGVESHGGDRVPATMVWRDFIGGLTTNYFAEVVLLWNDEPGLCANSSFDHASPIVSSAQYIYIQIQRWQLTLHPGVGIYFSGLMTEILCSTSEG